jgi:lipid A 3-O-deacylase
VNRRLAAASIVLVSLLGGREPASAGGSIRGSLGPKVAATTSELALTAGVGGVFDAERFAEGGLELQLRPGLFGLQAILGATSAENESFYGYLGLRREFIRDPLYVAVFTGLGRFRLGERPDLGGGLEFRSGIELGFRAPEDWRVGLVLYHLSNGGIERRNPGSETLALTWSVPLRERLR